MTERNVRVGVGVILLNQDGDILLGRRCGDAPDTGGIYEPGSYTLPGGKQEFGETYEETAVREVAEETGIWLRKKDVSLFCIHDDIAEDRHFLTVTVKARAPYAKPVAMEPGKIDGWKFYRLSDIPAILYSPSAYAIDRYVRGL